MIIISTILILLLVSTIGITIIVLNENSLSQAQKIIKEGKYENAVDILKREHIKSPQDIQVLLSLGDCYINLTQYDVAMSTYIKINEMNKILNTEEKLHLYKKMGYIYNKFKQNENLFEIYLKILQIDANDYEANKGIAYVLLKMKQFHLAISYFETILKDKNNKDIQDLIAYYIALYYSNQIQEAKQVIETILENNADNMYFQLLFISIFQKNNSKEAISYINKIFNKAKEEDVMRMLIRLYSYFLHYLNVYPDSLDLFLKIINNKDYPSKLQREAHYFYLFFLCQIHELVQANQMIHDFEASYGKYRNLNKLKISIDIKDENFDEIIEFEDLYKKEMESLIPEDFLFCLAGLQTESFIILEKFFNIADESNPTLLDQFEKKDLPFFLDQYYYLSNEKFLKFTKNACQLMKFKIIKSLTGSFNDNIYVYLCKKTNKFERTIVCFAQCKENTHLSDIFINELINKRNINKAREIILISNGVLTNRAQKIVDSMLEFDIFQDDKLYELFVNILN